MNLTTHAQQRMQQRGISRETVDYVLTHGRVSHSRRQAIVLTGPSVLKSAYCYVVLFSTTALLGVVLGVVWVICEAS